MPLLKLANDYEVTNKRQFNRFLDDNPDYKQEYDQSVKGLDDNPTLSKFKNKVTMGPEFEKRQQQGIQAQTIGGMLPGALSGGILSNMATKGQGGRRGLATMGGSLAGSVVGGLVGNTAGRFNASNERSKRSDQQNRARTYMNNVNNDEREGIYTPTDYMQADWLKRNVLTKDQSPSMRPSANQSTPLALQFNNVEPPEMIQDRYNADRLKKKKRDVANTPIEERGQGDPGTYLMWSGSSVRDQGRQHKMGFTDDEDTEQMPDELFNQLIDYEDRIDEMEANGASEQELRALQEEQYAFQIQNGVFYD